MNTGDREGDCGHGKWNETTKECDCFGDQNVCYDKDSTTGSCTVPQNGELSPGFIK